MKNRRRYYLILLILPLILALTAVLLNNARGPYWLGSNLDPEYVYLLNAANLAGLKGVGHIDHPGTPVQALGAVIIRVVHFFNFSSEIDWHTHLIQRPEYYLKAINFVLVMLNVLVFLALGVFTYLLTNNFVLSLWLQISPFFSITLLQFGLTRVTPEPLLFFSSSMMIVFLVVKVHSKDVPSARENINMIIIFALVTGFGVACKVTFIPLAIIPLILLPKLKNKVLYLFASGIGFVIFTLPIIRMYPRFFEWIVNLLSHSGRYGSGPSKLISTEKYLKNIVQLLLGNPFFSIILVLALLIVLITLFTPKLRRVSRASIHFKLLAAVTAAQLAGLLMVSKHSAHHYLLPVLNLSGIVLFLIFHYFNHFQDHYDLNPKIIPICAVIFLVTLTGLVNPWGQLNKRIDRLENLKKKSLELHQQVKEDYKDYAKIFYYLGSSPEYALKFGNDLSRSYHTEFLERQYKSIYFYDIWTKRFTGFDYHETISFEAIRGKYKDKIVFQGSRGIKIPGLKLKKISGKRFYEGIYLLNDL